MVRLQGHALDVMVTGEQEEGLGHDAGLAVPYEFQAHRTRADRPHVGRVQAQVATASIVMGTWVATCKYNGRLKYMTFP